MKRFYLMILFLLVTLFSVQSQDKAVIDDLLKRVEELEKQNKELTLEIDQNKRDISDSAAGSNQVGIQKDQWGTEFGMDISGGIQGAYSQGSLGIVFPKIKNMISFGARATYSSSFIPLTVFDSSGRLQDKYSAMAVTGTMWMTFGSPLLFNFIRMYGGFDVSFGYTLTPTVVNLYGPNLTFGFFSYGGIEFYSSRWTAFFIETGGGYMNAFGDKTSQYLQENDFIGSGFGMRVGTRIYFAKIKKSQKGNE